MSQAIKDIDKILGGFYKRMKGTEQEVKSIKQSIKNSEAVTKVKTKQSVPHIVRVSE